MYKFLKDTLVIINKQALLISFLIVISAYLFMYLPFFIYTPMIAMGYDAFDYFYCVEQMNNGQLPAFDFLPLGFPLFVWFVGFFSNKIITVIIVQNLISLFSYLFFLYSLNKYLHLKSGLILVSFAFSIFIMGPFTVQLATSLRVESIYTSSLFILTSLLIFVIYSKNRIVWLTFSVCLIIPALIRSNGVYIYFLFFGVLVFMLVNRYERKFYWLLITPFSLLNLAWAIFNWQAYGLFFISNPTRILNGVAHHFPETWFPGYPKEYASYMTGDKDKKASIDENEKYNVSYDSTFYLYNMLFTEKKHPFYYSEISARYFENIAYFKYKNTKYSEYYKNDLFHYNLQEYYLFDGALPISKSLKKLILKEYYREDEFQYAKEWFEDKENTMYAFFDPYESVTAKMSLKEIYQKSYNFWFFMTYVLHMIYEKIFWNYIWLVVYYISALVILFQLIKAKFRDKDMFVFFMFFLVHFMSIAILPIFFRAGHGYSYMTEFVIYLLPVLVSAYFWQKLKEAKKMKSQLF